MTRSLSGRLSAPARRDAGQHGVLERNESDSQAQLKAMSFADASGHLAPGAQGDYATQRDALAPIQARGDLSGDVHAMLRMVCPVVEVRFLTLQRFGPRSDV